MQFKTICALIFTITIVTFNSIEAAPVDKTKNVPSNKVVSAPASKPEAVPVAETPKENVKMVKPALRGAREDWKSKIDPSAKKLFNDYKKHITKKLQETHKVPANFTPKPDRHATQVVAGILHHYLVKIPANKFAYVTIAHRAWEKPNYGKAENVNVRPQLYALNDKNI